ncbi:FMN-binding protein [Kribbella antiqua]|uniref:FMN-binding protein n=1 Tax=Kribbella antiqua TaxID=2512217 RepID=UPI001050A64B|nr:FMN-binding protein [Kribbella antiqua]
MKRIVFSFLATVSIVVLLFAYRTSTSGRMTAAPAISGGSVESTPAPSSTSNAQTVTGEVASTQWGPVQVQLTIENGKITAVNVLQYPNGNHRDVEINDYALPILIDETTKAQSAQIDMVSGATVTSDGYIRSLQSALDQAK